MVALTPQELVGHEYFVMLQYVDTKIYTRMVRVCDLDPDFACRRVESLADVEGLTWIATWIATANDLRRHGSLMRTMRDRARMKQQRIYAILIRKYGGLPEGITPEDIRSSLIDEEECEGNDTAE